MSVGADAGPWSPFRFSDEQDDIHCVEVLINFLAMDTSITAEELLHRVRSALLQLHKRGRKFSKIILWLLEAPDFLELFMSLANMRLFGVVSYGQVAVLNAPPTQVATCKVPGTYALHHDLAGLKPLSLPPPADADEAQYHGPSLNPP